MGYVERGSSIATAKRCMKKWYWRYKKGLVPKEKSFGALDLGTWVHEAKALWYQDQQRTPLYLLFNAIAEAQLFNAKQLGAPDHVLEKGDELALLGEAMCKAYEKHYNSDKDIEIIAVEVALDFLFYAEEWDLRMRHMLKPDAVVRTSSGIWLLETKTTPSIRTDYLVLDNQARGYGAMAEPALKKAGILKPHETLEGILYDFLRKGWPDERETDSEGRALNKNGTVSARQPTPLFKRFPLPMTRAAKAITLRRVKADMLLLGKLTESIRNGDIDPMNIPKTTNKSCVRCEYFKMCASEESGADIRDMQRSAYTIQNPYTYDESPETEEAGDFDMG